MSQEPWTSEFQKDALKRIIAYEDFLKACGITAVAGMELEFHFDAINNKYVKPQFIKGFRDSPFVEKLTTEPHPAPRNVAEIVVGAGPRNRTGVRPEARSPHTIALAMASVKKSVITGASDYGMDVNLGATKSKRVRSLQSNISLWDSTTNTPLFPDLCARIPPTFFKTNELTACCVESTLRAQHALSALVANNDAAFDRQKSKPIQTFGTNYDSKYAPQTLAIRRNTGGTPFKEAGDKDPHRIPPSIYFEDRFPSSEAEPALAMLINVGGIVEGIKTYMKAHNLVDEHGEPDPQQFQLHMRSPEFANSSVILHDTSTEDHGRINAPWNYALPAPSVQQEALAVFRESDLAKEVMGEDFHQRFCAACRMHMGRSSVSTGQAR